MRLNMDEVSQREVDQIKNIVHPRNRNYIGDILVISSDYWQGRIIKPFTGEYNHTAMRTHPNMAMAIYPNGFEKCILSDPPEEWASYIMLRHRGLNEKDRDELKRLNRNLSKKYDLNLLFKLAWRQMKGIEPGSEDLSGNGFDCSSRPARMYEMLDYPIIDGIHSSQIRPVHFLESEYFDEVRHWKRKNEMYIL